MSDNTARNWRSALERIPPAKRRVLLGAALALALTLAGCGRSASTGNGFYAVDKAAPAEAAEAYWDAYRNAAKNGWDEESSGLFDEAFDRLAELTGGEDSPLFTAIDELTEDLKDSVPDNAWTDIEDLGDTAYKILDAVTWQDDTGNGLKTEDVSGFKALPAEIEQKAMEGLLKGASRMRIDMDGYSVGKVVAPYVSQEIAAEMLGGK